MSFRRFLSSYYKDVEHMYCYRVSILLILIDNCATQQTELVLFCHVSSSQAEAFRDTYSKGDWES
jgi:hypothetical protein